MQLIIKNSVTPHIFTILVMLCMPLSASEADELSDLKEEAIDIATRLYLNIKKEVIAAKEQGSPAEAIRICEDIGPRVALKLSTGKWYVGRTSLKLRRSANMFDPWEKKIMQSFEQRFANGEAIRHLEHDEVVYYRGQKLYRYMKALPTKRGCLLCHGNRKSLKPEVRDALDKYYPEDVAVGFELGDIRGALTLVKTLSD